MNIMASNQDIKKPQRKADEDLPERLLHTPLKMRSQTGEIEHGFR